MQNPTCTFHLESDGASGMRLLLEPEGQDFLVPSGKRVEVRFFGTDRPVTLRCDLDANGCQLISFWPENGTYELLLDGRDVWELALNAARGSSAR